MPLKLSANVADSVWLWHLPPRSCAHTQNGKQGYPLHVPVECERIHLSQNTHASIQNKFIPQSNEWNQISSIHLTRPNNHHRITIARYDFIQKILLITTIIMYVSDASDKLHYIEIHFCMMQSNIFGVAHIERLFSTAPNQLYDFNLTSNSVASRRECIISPTTPIQTHQNRTVQML